MEKQVGLLALCAVLLAAACIPVPVIAPPMKMTLGGGPAFGDLNDDRFGEQEDSAGAFSLTAAIHPMQYFTEELVLDLGAGFVFETFPNESLRTSPLVGAHFEVGYALWMSGDMSKGESQGRLYLIGRGEALSNTGPRGSSGLGVGVGLGLELVSWQDNPVARIGLNSDADGDVDLSSFAGYVIGEMGIGAEIMYQTRQVGPQDYDAVFFRLIFRSPTTLGLLLLPVGS